MRFWTCLRAAAWLGLAAGLAGCGHPGDREYEAGLRELEGGKYVRARDLFDRSIQRRPGSILNAPAYNGIGLASWHLRDVGRAAQAFEQARKLNPNYPDPAFNLGVVFQQGDDPIRAAMLFEEAAMLEPSHPRALEMLGRVYYDQRRWDEALRRWDDALRRAPGSPRILTAMALAELQYRGPKGALAYLGRALESDPRYAPALHNLFVIQARTLNDPVQAEPFARQYLEVAPPDDPHAAPVRAWLDARKTALASLIPPAGPPIALRTPPEAAPGTPPAAPVPAPAPLPAPPRPLDAQALLADAAKLAAARDPGSALGRCLQAAEMARRAGDEARREEALNSGVRLAPEMGSAHLALGRYLAEKGRTDDAADAFQKAVTLSPNSADAHAALADVALKAGDFDVALVSLQKVLEFRREDADARWKLAALYDTTLNRRADAIREYRQFADLFPEDPRILKARERLQALEPAAPPAPPPATTSPAPPSIAAPVAPPAVAAPPEPPVGVRRLQFRTPAQRDPETATTAFNRGVRSHNQGDLDRAIYHYTAAIESDDRYVLAFYNLGEVYRAKGDLDLALDAYRRALAINPDDASIRYNLALVLDTLGDPPAALQQLDYLIARDPRQAAAHYLAGLIHSRVPRERDAARRHLSRFIELQPGDPKADDARRWLAENP